MTGKLAGLAVLPGELALSPMGPRGPLSFQWPVNRAVASQKTMATTLRQNLGGDLLVVVGRSLLRGVCTRNIQCGNAISWDVRELDDDF